MLIWTEKLHADQGKIKPQVSQPRRAKPRVGEPTLRASVCLEHHRLGIGVEPRLLGFGPYYRRHWAKLFECSENVGKKHAENKFACPPNDAGNTCTSEHAHRDSSHPPIAILLMDRDQLGNWVMHIGHRSQDHQAIDGARSGKANLHKWYMQALIQTGGLTPGLRVTRTRPPSMGCVGCFNLSSSHDVVSLLLRALWQRSFRCCLYSCRL